MFFPYGGSGDENDEALKETIRLGKTALAFIAFVSILYILLSLVVTVHSPIYRWGMPPWEE